MEKDYTQLLIDFKNLNRFVIEMFNDNRLNEELKNEYAEKYNSLGIHKV